MLLEIRQIIFVKNIFKLRKNNESSKYNKYLIVFDFTLLILNNLTYKTIKQKKLLIIWIINSIRINYLLTIISNFLFYYLIYFFKFYYNLI